MLTLETESKDMLPLIIVFHCEIWRFCTLPRSPLRVSRLPIFKTVFAPCLQKELSCMWFCLSHQRLAQCMSLMVCSLVVLGLWFGFLLTCVSSTEARTVERSLPPTTLGNPQELETF